MRKYYRDDCPEDDRMELLGKMFVYRGIDNLVHEAFDHKGLLTVYWNQIPTKENIETVRLIWEFLHEDFIEHYVVRYELIDHEEI